MTARRAEQPSLTNHPNNACWCCYREAFAAWLPIWGVPFSYAVAVSYVLVDTYDKGHLAYLQAGVELKGNAELHPEVNLPRCGGLTITLIHSQT